jgi:hypothetical protein
MRSLHVEKRQHEEFIFPMLEPRDIHVILRMPRHWSCAWRVGSAASFECTQYAYQAVCKRATFVHSLIRIRRCVTEAVLCANKWRAIATLHEPLCKAIRSSRQKRAAATALWISCIVYKHPSHVLQAERQSHKQYEDTMAK